MEERFRIYIDRLRDGSKQVLDDDCSAEFLDVDETDVRLTGNVSYHIEANLAEDELVVAITAHTTAGIPCSICNQFVQVPIGVEGIYHAVPVAEIAGAVYDCSDIIREMLLLELPNVAECVGGCSERKEIEAYLIKPDKKNGQYRPFEELDAAGS